MLLFYLETSKVEQEKQPYKYNDKELDQMHGLNLHDYSARYYEAALGRFTSVDPMTEKYYNISPYVYCANNPMRFIDPTGMFFVSAADSTFADQIDVFVRDRITALENDKSRLIMLNQDIGDLDLRISELNKTRGDIQGMRKDEKYGYKFTQSINDQSGIRLEGENIIWMAFDTQDGGAVVHEMRHGGQISRRKYDPHTQKGYGVSKEVDAYKAQYSVNGGLNYYSTKWSTFFKTPTGGEILDIHDITPKMVNDIGTIVNGEVMRFYPPKNISITNWNKN